MSQVNRTYLHIPWETLVSHKITVYKVHPIKKLLSQMSGVKISLTEASGHGCYSNDLLSGFNNIDSRLQIML